MIKTRELILPKSGDFEMCYITCGKDSNKTHTCNFEGSLRSVLGAVNKLMHVNHLWKQFMKKSPSIHVDETGMVGRRGWICGPKSG